MNRIDDAYYLNHDSVQRLNTIIQIWKLIELVFELCSTESTKVSTSTMLELKMEIHFLYFILNQNTLHKFFELGIYLTLGFVSL